MILLNIDIRIDDFLSLSARPKFIAVIRFSVTVYYSRFFKIIEKWKLLFFIFCTCSSAILGYILEFFFQFANNEFAKIAE